MGKHHHGGGDDSPWKRGDVVYHAADTDKSRRMFVLEADAACVTVRVLTPNGFSTETLDADEITAG